MDTTIIVEGKRRRSWPSKLKRRIVEESYAPDVTVCGVARRHNLDPAQLFAWRKKFREAPPPSFVPTKVCGALPTPHSVTSIKSVERIEIALTNGRRLITPVTIDARRLLRLVDALDAL